LNLAEEDRKRNVETILNPISDQMSVLRSSMIPGLLETMKKNNSQQTPSVRIFEIGKIFHATQKGSLPEENEKVAGLLTGNRSEQTWHSKKSEIDFYDLKGVLEGFFEALMIRDLVFEKIEGQLFPYFQKGYAAVVKSGDSLIGSLGKIEAKVLKNFGLKQDAFVFDLSFNAIQNLLPESVTARLLPKFPSISRDITIIVNRSVAVGSVLKQMEAFSGKEPLIESIFLFDAFEGAPLSEGKKSLSFRIIYRSGEKTLKEKNIQKIHETISKMLLNEFDAYLPEL
jgi:phenylalanyl-tRNA synthetase beta chain